MNGSGTKRNLREQGKGRTGKGSTAAVGLSSVNVCRVNFMVKLLRACVWMPWRKKAMKDVASCDKPRGDASNL